LVRLQLKNTGREVLTIWLYSQAREQGTTGGGGGGSKGS
jgi:hypothetical protein